MLIAIAAMSVVSGVPIEYFSLLLSFIQIWISTKGGPTMKHSLEKVLSGACGVETHLYPC